MVPTYIYKPQVYAFIIHCVCNAVILTIHCYATAISNIRYYALATTISTSSCHLDRKITEKNALVERKTNARFTPSKSVSILYQRITPPMWVKHHNEIKNNWLKRHYSDFMVVSPWGKSSLEPSVRTSPRTPLVGSVFTAGHGAVPLGEAYSVPQSEVLLPSC